MLYHLSKDDNLTKLTPQIPECAVGIHEDTNTKRVCFSDSIEGCLSALQEIPKQYYVYIPAEEIDFYTPTVDEVRDAKFTHEVWILQEVKVKCIGVIQSKEYDSAKMHNTGRGRTVFFHYPYEWIEKY